MILYVILISYILHTLSFRGRWNMASNLDAALSVFRQRKILLFSELQSLLGCSTATVRRRLNDWKTYTSYNHNGRYYVLPETPKFNEFHIWQYNGVYFSKHGTLQKTLIALVNEASAGLNVFEASTILGVSVHNFLSQQFIRHDTLHREKHKGVYIYYSQEPSVCSGQKKGRHQRFSIRSTRELPTDVEAVIILVELIKHSDDSMEQLYRRVRYKGFNASILKIRHLLEYHDLLKKTSE